MLVLRTRTLLSLPAEACSAGESVNELTVATDAFMQQGDKFLVRFVWFSFD
jgi:hypothetical protein